MSLREDEATELFLCTCGDVSDQIIMRYWTDYEKDVYPSVYVSFYLNELPFFKRLWYGIKYIFGYRCKYGHFGEIILKPEDYTKMEKVVDFLKKVYKYEEEKALKYKQDNKAEN